MKPLIPSAQLCPLRAASTSTIMQLPQMLLVFSILITLVIALPTGARNQNNTDFPQNVSEASDFSENKSIFLLVEEKRPNSGPVIIEFIYNGNSNDNSIVNDKDRYMIDYEPLQIKNNKKINIGKKENQNKTLNLHKADYVQTTESANLLKTEGSQKIEATSLIPEEVSPLIGKLPKYFYDAFNPIQPFPELHYIKPNTVEVKKEQTVPAAYLPLYKKEQRRIQDTAGPQLNPSSIYDREFSQPIFD